MVAEPLQQILASPPTRRFGHGGRVLDQRRNLLGHLDALGSGCPRGQFREAASHPAIRPHLERGVGGIGDQHGCSGLLDREQVAAGPPGGLHLAGPEESIGGGTEHGSRPCRGIGGLAPALPAGRRRPEIPFHGKRQRVADRAGRRPCSLGGLPQKFQPRRHVAPHHRQLPFPEVGPRARPPVVAGGLDPRLQLGCLVKHVDGIDAPRNQLAAMGDEGAGHRAAPRRVSARDGSVGKVDLHHLGRVVRKKETRGRHDPASAGTSGGGMGPRPLPQAGVDPECLDTVAAHEHDDAVDDAGHLKSAARRPWPDRQAIAQPEAVHLLGIVGRKHHATARDHRPWITTAARRGGIASFADQSPDPQAAAKRIAGWLERPVAVGPEQ